MIIGPSNPPLAAPSPTAPGPAVSPVQLACSDFLSCPQHRPLVYGLSCMLQVGKCLAAPCLWGCNPSAYWRTVCFWVWQGAVIGVRHAAAAGNVRGLSGSGGSRRVDPQHWGVVAEPPGAARAVCVSVRTCATRGSSSAGRSGRASALRCSFGLQWGSAASSHQRWTCSFMPDPVCLCWVQLDRRPLRISLLPPACSGCLAPVQTVQVLLGLQAICCLTNFCSF